MIWWQAILIGFAIGGFLGIAVIVFVEILKSKKKSKAKGLLTVKSKKKVKAKTIKKKPSMRR